MKFRKSAECAIRPAGGTGLLFLRGVAGIALMAYAFTQLRVAPVWGWSLLGIAILLLKGCPACWGMHMANALRRSRRPASLRADEGDTPRRRKPYQPKDMAAHLFPPEDVARFRQQRQP